MHGVIFGILGRPLSILKNPVPLGIHSFVVGYYLSDILPFKIQYVWKGKPQNEYVR